MGRSGPATLCRLAVAALQAGRSAVVLTRDREEHARMRGLLCLFLPELSHSDLPSDKAGWQLPLLDLPAPGERRGNDHRCQRLSALYGLACGGPRCLVASLESCLLKLPPRNFFDQRSLDLARGNEYSPDLILDQAAEWGYLRVPMVTRPGEMARRGDILDIFPPGHSKPLRLDFFGDSIDEIRIFDPESQRSLSNLDEITLIPASDLPVSDQDLAASREYLEQMVTAGRLDENAAYSFKKALDAGGEDLLPGPVWPRPSQIEDWLPDDTVWLLPGESDCATALTESRQSLVARLDTAENPQPASLALRDQDLPPWQGQQAVFAARLVMGVEDQGLPMPERQLHGFAELFPTPGAQDRPWLHLANGLREWRRERRQVILSFASERGRRKFCKLAEQDGILPALRYAPEASGLFALVSPFRQGVDLVWDDCLVLGEEIIYPKAEKSQRKASRAFKGLDSFDGIAEGTLLVHRDYGIGRFAGLHHLELNGTANDYLLLEYSGRDKLYVPADRLGLIQGFKGPEGSEPALDRLGGNSWQGCREKARKAIEKIAADLVEMYAWRKVAKGFRYDPPGDLYHEFEATFGFEETPDQARAIEEVLADMARREPMDRLVCGDVGFGKTEVALRAAFRAAAEGRQVAMLCPTTILAEQHYQTFRARLAGFPVNVGLLSRFVPAARQKQVLAACAAGQTDILIGTHRLLSNDVSLPNLALLILDEEQRFGVRHKEKLKALKKNVDVLTLTATPIPRTLQLSMSGIRDLSVIETAPAERKPVATAVVPRDKETLARVLSRELEREGQVFWVYNRVHGLAQVADYVQKLAPGAKVGMAHGQMPENELEETMRKFWHGELDILVCTSIVESGLDFPRANTLVIDQAQMFGLGQLYQLRGRVGRSDRQAYAYMIVPDPAHLGEQAEERMRVIMDMDYLGAGFQVAMEDLRLRGAGNILGEVQSGHLGRVGLDLYLEMLEEAVNRLKGTPQEIHGETELTLGIPAHIPSSYIADGKERLAAYKSLASAANGQAREDLALGLRDRYGSFPQELENFLAVLDLKQFLSGLQVEKAEINQNLVRLTWANGQTAVDPARIVALAGKTPGAKILPPASLILPLAAGSSIPDALAGLRQALTGIAVNTETSLARG